MCCLKEGCYRNRTPKLKQKQQQTSEDICDQPISVGNEGRIRKRFPCFRTPHEVFLALKKKQKQATPFPQSNELDPRKSAPRLPSQFCFKWKHQGAAGLSPRYADKHLTESKPKPNQSTVSAKKGVKQLDKPVKGQNMDPKGKPVESVKCAKVKPSQPILRYT